MNRVLIVAALCAAGGFAAHAQSPASSDTLRLERIRASLVGHESDPTETVFKNISLLKGKPASRLSGMMEALTGLIGVECEYCHVRDDFASDDKPAKRTARAHFAMIARLNKDDFSGENKVSCWTCHRGKPKPELTGGGG